MNRIYMEINYTRELKLHVIEMCTRIKFTRDSDLVLIKIYENMHEN